MKCRMMVFHQFTSVKNMYRKIYFTIEMQPKIYILEIFLVPYAFTGCNLRVDQFDVSSSNMIIALLCVNISSAQVNGQWKCIICSQLGLAHVAGQQ